MGSFDQLHLFNNAGSHADEPEPFSVIDSILLIIKCCNDPIYIDTDFP